MLMGRGKAAKLFLGLVVTASIGVAILYGELREYGGDPSGEIANGNGIAQDAADGVQPGDEKVEVTVDRQIAAEAPEDPIPLLAGYYDALLEHEKSCFANHGFPQWRSMALSSFWDLPRLTTWGVGPTNPREARRLGMLGVDLESYPSHMVVISGGGEDPEYDRVFELCTAVRSRQADGVEELEARMDVLEQETAARVRTVLADRVNSLVACALSEYGQPGQTRSFLELMTSGRGPHLYPGLPEALKSVGIEPELNALGYRWPWPVGNFTPEGPVVARELKTMFPKPSDEEVELALAWSRCRETSLPQPVLERILRENWQEELSRNWDQLAPMVAELRAAVAEIPSTRAQGNGQNP